LARRAKHPLAQETSNVIHAYANQRHRRTFLFARKALVYWAFVDPRATPTGRRSIVFEIEFLNIARW
jgi:hypothetical protein